MNACYTYVHWDNMRGLSVETFAGRKKDMVVIIDTENGIETAMSTDVARELAGYMMDVADEIESKKPTASPVG